jgi:hypothetical protein
MRTDRRATRRGWLVVALAFAVLLAATVPAVLIDAGPYLLPAVLLVGVLAARRYPGERTLLSLISPARRRRARCVAQAPPRRASHALLPRGGRLLGCALAVRPPPRSSAVLS